MVRVITGSAKGRRLRSVEGFDKRPTTGRVKESLFSILGQNICGADVLDLFAGTGNLGIEALSRGARSAIFVEVDRECQEIIRCNLEATRLQDKARILRCDVWQALARLGSEGTSFDISLADPPYSGGYGDRLLGYLDDGALLRDYGIFVFEHSAYEELPPCHRNLQTFSERRYGRTSVHFYQYLKHKE